MNRMNALHGDLHYNFYPKTYSLPKEHAMCVEEMENNPGLWWIVKPAASAQGRGIYFTNSISELPYKSNCVVSHYINNPMLINGYKFDLRIYVGLTSVNPLRIYMYEEGLVRFATAKYKDLGTEKFAKYTHLTNYSVNKFNANFIQNADAAHDSYGSKWSLSAFWKYCKSNGIDDVLLRNRMEDLIIKTILSVEHIMTKAFEMYVPYQKNCFEVLGFDILVDDTYKPWLLEVNLSPSLSCDSPIDQKIKGNLMADLFTMCGIVPLERRSKVEARKQGLHYGAYMEGPEKPSSKASKSKPRRSGLAQSPFNLDFNSTAHKIMNKSKLSKEEKDMLKETDEEYKLRGHFRRIFPNGNY